MMNMKKWSLIPAAFALMLSSCTCTTSKAVLQTCNFEPEQVQDEPYAFYRKGEQYYLACYVDYKCEADGLEVGSLLPGIGPSVKLPVEVKREPLRKQYYFLLPPAVAQQVLGVEVAAPPKGSRYCIPAEEWDATAAQQVCSPVSQAEIVFRTGEAPCRYDSQPSQFEVCVPAYRPWDYWVKMPAMATLFLGVDIPCTLVGNVVWAAVDIVAYPFVAMAQPCAEPMEIKTAQ